MDVVYLVVAELGGLHGAYLDREMAHQRARVAEAVVVEVPIVADYRPRATQTEGSGT